MAINMGFAGRKQIASDLNEERFSAHRGQVNQLINLIGGDLQSASPGDVAVRISLINMLTELLLADEIEASELVELLDDWMEENFCVLADESSHRNIADELVKVRKELTFCAVNDLDLPTGSITV